jgi:hypothetical protein
VNRVFKGSKGHRVSQDYVNHCPAQVKDLIWKNYGVMWKNFRIKLRPFKINITVIWKSFGVKFLMYRNDVNSVAFRQEIRAK